MPIVGSKSLIKQKRVLIIGDGGTGKTRILGTFAKLADDEGWNAAALLVTADPEGAETFDSMGIDCPTLLIKDWTNPFGTINEMRAWHKEQEGKLTILLVDDVGEIMSQADDEITHRPWGRYEEQAARNSKDDFAVRVDKEIAEGRRQKQQVHWGALGQTLKSFFTQAFDIGFSYVVITALANVRQHRFTGEDLLVPDLQGAVRTWLPARCSFVGRAFYVEYDQYKRIIRRSLTSKDRSQANDTHRKYCLTTGGRTWVDPSAVRLMMHLTGAVEPETEDEKQIGKEF